MNLPPLPFFEAHYDCKLLYKGLNLPAFLIVCISAESERGYTSASAF